MMQTTDGIKNNCVLQSTDAIITILNATFKKGGSTLRNVTHFTIESEIDAVTRDAQYVVSKALQSPSVQIIITSSLESIQMLYLL